MAKYAQIENEVVINIIEWDGITSLDINNLVLADENAHIGGTYIDNKFSALGKYVPSKWEEIRVQRDLLLKETDWWVLADRNPTQEQLQYRQKLRDITKDFNSPSEVVFPEKPIFVGAQ
jgi:hypothetical protein